VQTLYTVLSIIGAAIALVGGFILWGFRTGKWTQQHAGDLVALTKSVAELKIEQANLEHDIKEGLEALKAAISSEGSDRRAQLDAVNAIVGRLEYRIALSDERTKLQQDHAAERMAEVLTRFGRIENRVESMQRQVDRRRAERETDN
jgi:hypothetical protein